jgi:hypothetical protein
MNGSWLESTYVRGEVLVEWLDANGHLTPRGAFDDRFHSNDARHVRKWRVGGAATVWTVDRVLCRLGRHLHELPDEAWYPPDIDQPAKLVEAA